MANDPALIAAIQAIPQPGVVRKEAFSFRAEKKVNHTHFQRLSIPRICAMMICSTRDLIDAFREPDTGRWNLRGGVRLRRCKTMGTAPNQG
jgi:hypothetical protein